MSSTHCFNNAHDFNIGSLALVNTNSTNLEKSPFQLLYDNVAIEAAHNSAERYDAPTCHEDTRKAVQEEIHSWITEGDQDVEPKRILTVMGPAGSGKTAIAGSIADTCDERRLLAGSFFFASFSPSESRRSKRHLVATLAYHLISLLDEEHPLRRAILTVVKRDPAVFRKRLKDQFRCLLIEPFTVTRHQFDASTLPKVFILDGLDEVEATNSRQPGRDAHEVRFENEADQEEILYALLYAAKSNAFPFRIIIASRPERAITTFFSDIANDTTRRIFLDRKYDPDSDIRLYFNAKFAEIRRRYRLPSSWPSEEEMKCLVGNASGQFIYATTVIRFLQSGRHSDPQRVLTSLQSSRCGEVGALAPLDALYTRILGLSPDVSLALRWIRAIEIWGSFPALFLNQLLQDHAGQADYVLENLTSLVWIPSVHTRSSWYRVHHKSLLDFLRDESRCGNEFAQAFLAGDDFCCTHSALVYENKSPAVLLPETQQVTFIDDFIRAQHRLNYSNSLANTLTQTKLMATDVVWWVHQAFVNPNLKEGERIVGNPILIYWFESFHSQCQTDNCLPVCKHWRSNILRACTGIGWCVPNAIALFRESLGFEPTGPYDPGLGPYFHPKDLRQGPRPATTLTQYTVDEEYQATLDLVVAMRSRLPADWKTQVELARQNDRCARYRGFTDVIAKIREELGIEVPDVLRLLHWAR